MLKAKGILVYNTICYTYCWKKRYAVVFMYLCVCMRVRVNVGLGKFNGLLEPFELYESQHGLFNGLFILLQLQFLCIHILSEIIYTLLVYRIQDGPFRG